MNLRYPRVRSIIVSVLLILGSATWLHGGGPLNVEVSSGVPVLWNVAAGPMHYATDQGGLGTLTNAEAQQLVQSAFQVWQDVPTSSLSFTHAGNLDMDINDTNWEPVFTFCQEGNPIVFDEDGSLVRSFFGSGAENVILGFAGIQCYTNADAKITSAIAVLNGRFIDGIDQATNPEITVPEFTSVFIHEFGHFIGIGHTQLNLAEALDGDPANDYAIPTMFPFAVNGEEQSTLHRDDIVTLSALYPSPEFHATTGTLTGNVYLEDGFTRFQGANVVVRNLADPLRDAISNVSGDRYFAGDLFVPPGSLPPPPPPEELLSLYEIYGLTPGAEYTIEVERVFPAFLGGSRVGPLFVQRPLPGPPEFWNGINEAGDDPPDNPAEFTTVTLTAGEARNEVNFVLNAPFPPIPVGTPPQNVIFTSEANVFSIRALGDTDSDGRTDTSRLFSTEPEVGAEVLIHPDGWLTVSGYTDAFYLLADTDGDYIADQTLRVPTNTSDGDGLAMRMVGGEPVIYLADASDGGTVRTFRDSDGDGVPEPATIFASSMNSGISLDFNANGDLFVLDVFSREVGFETQADILLCQDADNDLVADVEPCPVFSDFIPSAVALKVAPDGQTLYVVNPANGFIYTLRDTDGDARADKWTIFAGLPPGLSFIFNALNGLTFEPDGDLLVLAFDFTTLESTLLRYKDADGNGIVDGPPQTVVTGLKQAAGLAVGVEMGNHIPRAAAGQDQTIEAESENGTLVTLDASGSADADNDPLTYTWTGPFREGSGTVTGVNPTVTLPVGVATIGLAVSDGKVTSHDTLVVKVTSFTPAASTAFITVQRGQTARYPISWMPQFGEFNRTVSLSCENLPKRTSCSFSPASVTPGAEGASSELTITTTAQGAVLPAFPAMWPMGQFGLLSMGIVLSALLMTQLRPRRGKRSPLAGLAALTLSCLLLLATACGGSGKGATPTGSFSIKVNGTAGSLTKSTTVRLIVE